MFKSGFIALVGRTNVGKSTLMNRLIGQKVAITSNKPQTTRTSIRTILTEERGQMIFIDTPGIHKIEHKLGEHMEDTAKRTLGEADVVLWLVEPSKKTGAGDERVSQLLKGSKAKKVLVINKIDTVPRTELPRLIEMYRPLADFDEVVPVSAATGENEEELKNVIFDLLDEGPMYYDEDELTDQPLKQIAAELVRENALKFLKDEVPHGIAVCVELMKERARGGGYVEYDDDEGIVSGEGTGIFDIEASIICERDSHKGIIIGKQGSMLKKIGTAARLEMEAFMGCRIFLKLFVKVRKDWRDSEMFLKDYGFAEGPKNK